MPTDDFFFDFREVDVFGSEIDALVISVYKTTIAGIEVLDKQERTSFKARGIDSDPEVQQEIRCWDRQIQAMKYHAGNMGLVSLVLLFDDWLAYKHEKVFRGKSNACEWRSRFEQIAERLPPGPLPLPELEDMVTARNSIIHHRGEPTFKNQYEKEKEVNERFLGEDEDGKIRVAIEEPLLTVLASKLTSHVDFWNGQKSKQESGL
jgi:hypothetical protein